MHSNLKCTSDQSTQGLFVRVAGVLLGATGLAKGLSALGAALALDTTDPLTGMRLRQLLLLVGLVELLIAFSCFFVKRRLLSLLAVAWLSTNFVVYRLGLRLI